MKSPLIKKGDLVRVKPGTNDEHLPDSRIGLVLENERTDGTAGLRPVTDVFIVLFTNGKTLRFHEMWLETVDRHPGL